MFYYIWKQRFLEGSKLALTSSKQENVNKDLAAENERLKKLIGELTIAPTTRLKKTLEARRRG